MDKSKKGTGDLLPLCKISTTSDILVIKYSPNKEHIVAGCTDGTILVYASGTGELVHVLSNFDVTSEIAITSLQFRIDEKSNDANKLLSSYSNGNIILWNYETGSIIKQIHEDRQTFGVTYHSKLPKFLTVGDDGCIYLYDEETMHLEQKFGKGIHLEKAEGHTSRVFTSIFHPYQVNEFVSGGWDDNVHFWDLRQTTSLRFLRGPHICGDGIDFSTTGREILTCGYQKTNQIQLWHYKSGKLMSNLEPDIYKSMLYCGYWVTPDFIMTGGTDPALLRVVSLRSLTTVATFKGTTSCGVYSMDYYVKSGKQATSKKDVQSQGTVKLVFCIDKTIIESEILL